MKQAVADHGKAEYLTIDNRFHTWLLTAAQLLVDAGYVAPGRLVVVEEQYSYLRFDILPKAFSEFESHK